MRAPIFRSPIVLAFAAFVAGLVVKWGVNAEFSIGGTMVVMLWLLPLIGLGITSDEFFSDGWGRDDDDRSFFSSRENRLELLALLALPGIGFALDIASLTLETAAFASIGLIGIVACVQLVQLERKKRVAGHDL
ncbi:MAG TPA: hypothetical protein VFL16_10225 [Steroidobacteraceae bacterium]|nr:hypothetical protein [Steroidobacteraceae bacterium]